MQSLLSTLERNALAEAVSHIPKSFTGGGNYKDFGSRELLIGTTNMRREKNS